MSALILGFCNGSFDPPSRACSTVALVLPASTKGQGSSSSNVQPWAHGAIWLQRQSDRAEAVFANIFEGLYPSRWVSQSEACASVGREHRLASCKMAKHRLYLVQMIGLFWFTQVSICWFEFTSSNWKQIRCEGSLRHSPLRSPVGSHRRCGRVDVWRNAGR